MWVAAVVGWGQRPAAPSQLAQRHQGEVRTKLVSDETAAVWSASRSTFALLSC